MKWVFKFVYFWLNWLFDIFSLTESEAMEAQALYDFNARSAREVNFHKGDTLVLFKQVSNDWWKGSVRGQEGLIPDKYIMLKMRYVNIFFVKLRCTIFFVKQDFFRFFRIFCASIIKSSTSFYQMNFFWGLFQNNIFFLQKFL